MASFETEALHDSEAECDNGAEDDALSGGAHAASVAV